MRRFRGATTAAVVAVLVAGEGPASAQDGRVEAQQHVERGEKLYQISDYPAALVEFKRAHQLYPRPDLLFNIARCYEVMAKLQQAIDHYERYLREKQDAGDRQLVEARIASLRSRLGGASTDRPVAPRSWRTPAGWAALSLGTASLVTGIIFGAMAQSKADEFRTGVESGRTYAYLTDVNTAGKTYETLQIATLVAGGVLAAAGGGLLLWEWRRGKAEPDRQRATVAPIATHELVGLAASWRFE